MSGHSHWSKIKHQKGAADIERGKLFSKVIKLITVAARQGGNPEENTKLKSAIDKAKEVNMPWSNIERAIKRGTGELEGAELNEVVFEAFGPGNIALMIETITDNKNRSLAEIKQVLNKNSAKLAAEGSVRYLFERKGEVDIALEEQSQDLQDKEALEMVVIDAGAEDLAWDENALQVYTNVEDLEALKKRLEEKGVKIKSSGLGWLPKTEVAIGEKEMRSAEKLFEALDENEDVQDIYSNLKT